MNRCPCIDCLIFPLCKSQVIEYITNYPNFDTITEFGYIMYNGILAPKCSLIRHWLNDYIITSTLCFNIINGIYTNKGYSMSQCPCINCLIYPICKSQVIDFIKIHTSYATSNSIYAYDIHVNVLKPKCSIITKWINSYNKHEQYNILYKQFQIKG